MKNIRNMFDLLCPNFANKKHRINLIRANKRDV